MEACQELGEQHTRGQPPPGSWWHQRPRGRVRYTLVAARCAFCSSESHFASGTGFIKVRAAEKSRRGSIVKMRESRTHTARAAKVPRVRNAHFSEKVPRLYLDDCSAELSFCLFAIGGARQSRPRLIRRTRTFHEITIITSTGPSTRAPALAGLPQPHRDTRVVKGSHRAAIRASSTAAP